MKQRPKTIFILAVLAGYIILQFIWWEILLVKQTGQIIELRQKIVALNTGDATQLQNELQELQSKKKTQVLMVVGEGTVFLLLLLFGVHKIRQAYRKEEELNANQKNFFLSITHELKTPIAATKLQLQTLEKRELDKSIRDELVANALRETERLNSLIDNLLMANRLNSGEYIFKFEKQDLSELIRSIAGQYYASLLNSGELTLSTQPGTISHIDVTAFPSVIMNLIDNAVKYSFDHKKIAVSCYRKSNTIHILVSDEGVGIPDSEKHKVFNQFYRSGNEETRSTKGTGLGLYIVKYIVTKHSGEIMINNNQPKGTTFEIQLHGVQ